jgi:hypothetical protein
MHSMRLVLSCIVPSTNTRNEQLCQLELTQPMPHAYTVPDLPDVSGFQGAHDLKKIPAGMAPS